MGGIVAAETLLSITQEEPIHSPSHSQTQSTSSLGDKGDPSVLMFPYIQGILAFDTPYLGIAPGVVAHGAEKHWNTASSAYSAYTNVASAFGWGAKSPRGGPVDASKMLPAAQTAKAVRDSNADAAAAPLWQKYGKMALFAGAAGAVAAGGAAAYLKKDQISEGWGWATGHLEFVGSLARPEEMKTRLSSIAKLTTAQELGFTNIYTTLGHAAQGKSSWAGEVVGTDRTFCNLPKGDLKKYFLPAVNDKCTAETEAHMSMFEPLKNPGYYTMGETAKEILTEWADIEWYRESDGPGPGLLLDVDMVEPEEAFENLQKPDEAFENVKKPEEAFENVKKPSKEEDFDHVGQAVADNPWKDEL
jgi:hypothetical protein